MIWLNLVHYGSVSVSNHSIHCLSVLLAHKNVCLLVGGVLFKLLWLAHVRITPLYEQQFFTTGSGLQPGVHQIKCRFDPFLFDFRSVLSFVTALPSTVYNSEFCKCALGSITSCRICRILHTGWWSALQNILLTLMPGCSSLISPTF